MLHLTVFILTKIVFQIISLVEYPVTDAPSGSVFRKGINILQIAIAVMSALQHISNLNRWMYGMVREFASFIIICFLNFDEQDLPANNSCSIQRD